MKKLWNILTLLLAMTLFTSVSSAHMLWMKVNNYTPSVGEVIYLEIGFGHKFPADEMIKDGRIETLFALTPDNEKIEAENIFPGFYKFKMSGEGIYRFYASLKPGFMSTTTQGRKPGNKKTLDDVVSCFAFEISGQSIVRCGSTGKNEILKPVNSIDIIPVKTESSGGSQRKLTVRAIFKESPLINATICAVCMTCPLQEEKNWTQEIITDENGNAVIDLSSDGPWLFMVKNKIPYQDASVCDDFMYCTTLSLDL